MIRALWSDGVVYAAGTLLSRGVALLLLPLVTRVLSPSEYGALDLIVTLGVLVNLLVPLETSQALARLWNDRAEGAPRRRLAGTAWTFTLASHTAFAGACARFLAAGTVMSLIALVADRGSGWPSRRQWLDYAAIGVLFLGIGNGLVMWSEQRIPSWQ